MSEPRPGHFEYRLEKSLGACGDNVSEMQNVLNSIPAKEISTPIIKEITVQVPTDDSAANNTVQQVWGATKFYPFAFDQAQPSAGIMAVGDAGVPGGQLGVPMCVMGYCFEMEGEPLIWTLPGVSVVSAEANSALAPDVYTTADIGAFAAANGLLGPHVRPALFDYGTDSWLFIENYIRSQNFKWKVGIANIVDLPAEDVASCGDNAGPRGLSRADAVTPLYVQRMNQLYAGLTNFTTRSFIAQNATRDGVIPVGDANAGTSSYVPNRNGDFAKVAFGKERNTSKLYCNANTQWFRNPLYFRDGNPIQIFLEKNNGGTTYLTQALQHLGSSFNGQMTALPDGTGVAFPAAGAAGFLEWDSRAAVPTTVQQTTPTERIVYKWGEVKMRVGLKGALLMSEGLATLFQKMAMKSGTQGIGGSGPDKHFLGGVLDAEVVGRGA